MKTPVQQLLALPPGGSEFGPQQALRSSRELLEQIEPADVINKHLCDPQLAAAALSGLWLRHGFLDQSHSISQNLETAEGSYWHGIMHRREPDYGNARYWFRRVGQHPCFAGIAQELKSAISSGVIEIDKHSPGAAREVAALADEWNARAFVDLCQQAASGDQELRQACEVIADLEWQSLFDFCRSRAAGATADRK